MLKWTASAQKLTTDSPNIMPQTPRRSDLENRRRRARRATIANKENIPYATSTPMVRSTSLRNSPIVLAPLSDILNITPETKSITSNISLTNTITTTTTTPQPDVTLRNQTESLKLPRNRRHSTLGITLPSAVPLYARTLPRFQVEEYSPSTAASSASPLSPTGQQLALRGLLPDPFFNNARYFKTPEIKPPPSVKYDASTILTKTLLKKRKLNLELSEDCEQQVLKKPNIVETTSLSSTKMGDETLDKLIDAILDSARKDVKKKKPRKSFNLRRRTLLRNQPETVHELVLSPSYTAADDPASDLSFLLMQPIGNSDVTLQPVTLEGSYIPQLPPSPPHVPQTPTPVTPPPGSPKSSSVLCSLPTPISTDLNISTTTFKLETPIRTHQTRKRRQTHHSIADADASLTSTNQAKKFKVDSKNYFEIGLALPSIYV